MLVGWSRGFVPERKALGSPRLKATRCLGAGFNKEAQYSFSVVLSGKDLGTDVSEGGHGTRQMPDGKGEGSYKGTKKLNTREQWGRHTIWVFGDKGCPGA